VNRRTGEKERQMKKPVIMAVLLAAGAATYTLAFWAEAKIDDKAQIAALEDHLISSIKAKDLDGVMSVYVPDDTLFVFDVIPPREYVGARAYREDWKGVLENFNGPISAEISDLKITSSNGLGFGHSIQHFSGADHSGKNIDWTLRVTDCYKKIKGKWLIVHEHYSVPVDLQTAKADLTSKP
jgi:ketosteroid isomerase-like protein